MPFLHLGRAMGGTKATLEGALMNANWSGKPQAILSPRPEELLERARKMGISARLHERTVHGEPAPPWVVIDPTNKETKS